MKELGFFIDNLGNIIFYGEWKEQYDKNNRHQVHTSSFEDEVEADPRFQSLNLQYNPEMGLYGKAISFALQGMITMQNQTSAGESKMMMHSPRTLTQEQKDKLKELYPLLASFSKATVVLPKSEIIQTDDVLDSIDFYYEKFEIIPLVTKER